jgi:hypothetical protein
MKKPFDTLTEAELVALTSEGLRWYIDRACAENGIQLLPDAAPTKPSQTPIAPDGFVYQVAGLSFRTHDDAIAVRDFIRERGRVKLDYGHGDYNHKVIKPLDDDDEVVTTKAAFTETYSASIIDVKAEQKATSEAYALAREQYEEIVEKRTTIANGIMASYNSAIRYEKDRQALRHEYTRYLVLAEGDPVIAANFLKSAKPGSVTLLPELYTREVELGRDNARTRWQANHVEQTVGA